MRGTVALVYPYFRTEAPVQHLSLSLEIAALAAQMKALGIDGRQHD